MEKRTKFKVEIEVEVEYNTPDYAIGNTPYTYIETSLKDNELNIKTNAGKIVEFKPAKFERIEK